MCEDVNGDENVRAGQHRPGQLVAQPLERLEIGVDRELRYGVYVFPLVEVSRAVLSLDMTSCKEEVMLDTHFTWKTPRYVLRQLPHGHPPMKVR